MSPRAAWQLEAMGFSEVYDFTEGKIEWMAHGGPTEGKGPHYAVVGEVADRTGVLACRMGDHVADVAKKLDDDGVDYCVVLNDHDIVMGRIRRKNLTGDPDQRLEDVMEPGPTTVRPTEQAKALLGRMKKRNVPSILVTTKRGRLVGAVTQEALEGLLERPF